MKYLFVIIALLGTVYFLIKKRRIDFFTVSFFAATIYFLPAFYGYTYYSRSLDIKSYFVDETYMIMIFILTSLILGGIVFDLFYKETSVKKSIPKTSKLPIIATVFAIIGIVGTVLTTGSLLFQENKVEMLENLNLFHALMTVSASIGVVTSFNAKRLTTMIISILILLFDVYIGFRFTTALTTIGLFILYLSKINYKQRLLFNNFRIVFLGAVSAIFFFNYKTVYRLVKMGELSEATKTFFSFNNIIDSIRNSEPFITQMILNEVVTSNFKVGLEHFKDTLIQTLIPYGKKTLFGDDVDIMTFSNITNAQLFNGRENIASNYWAEYWSSGGWPILILAVLIYVIIMYVGSHLLYRLDSEFQAFIAVLITVWAFYVHRNTVVYQIKLSQQYIFLFILFLIISYIISKKNIRRY